MRDEGEVSGTKVLSTVFITGEIFRGNKNKLDPC